MNVNPVASGSNIIKGNNAIQPQGTSAASEPGTSNAKISGENTSGEYDPSIDNSKRAGLNIQPSEESEQKEKLDGQTILRLWDEAYENIPKKIANSIVFIGPTGSGKSTTIGLLNGGQLEERYRIKTGDRKGKVLTKEEYGKLTPKPKKSSIYIFPDGKGLPEVGTSRISQTLGSYVYQKDGYAYIDTGGTNDTRSAQEQSINSFSTYAMVTRSESSKFVLCSSYGDIVGRAKGFWDSLTMIKEFLPLEKTTESLLFLVTGVHDKGEPEDTEFLIADIEEIRTDFMEELEKPNITDITKKELNEKILLLDYLLRDNGKYIQVLNVPIEEGDIESLASQLDETVLKSLPTASPVLSGGASQPIKIQVPFSTGSRAELLEAFATYVFPGIKVLNESFRESQACDQDQGLIEQRKESIQQIEDEILRIEAAMEQRSKNAGLAQSSQQELSQEIEQLKKNQLEKKAEKTKVEKELSEVKQEIARLEASEAEVLEMTKTVTLNAATVPDEDEYICGTTGVATAKVLNLVASLGTEITADVLKAKHVINKKENKKIKTVQKGVSKTIDEFVKLKVPASAIHDKEKQTINFSRPMDVLKVELDPVNDNHVSWENATPAGDRMTEYSVISVNKAKEPKTCHINVYVKEKDSSDTYKKVSELNKKHVELQADSINIEREINDCEKKQLIYSELQQRLSEGAKSVREENEKVGQLKKQLETDQESLDLRRKNLADIDADIKQRIIPQYESLVRFSTTIHLNVEENITINDFFNIVQNYQERHK